MKSYPERAGLQASDMSKGVLANTPYGARCTTYYARFTLSPIWEKTC